MAPVNLKLQFIEVLCFYSQIFRIHLQVIIGLKINLFQIILIVPMYSAFIDSKVEKKSAKRDLSTYCLILFKIYSSSIKVPIRN